jgi:hypothetical protein
MSKYNVNVKNEVKAKLVWFNSEMGFRKFHHSESWQPQFALVARLAF